MSHEVIMDIWVRSGMAQEAARELLWFVVLILVGIGIVIWRDSKDE